MTAFPSMCRNICVPIFIGVLLIPLFAGIPATAKPSDRIAGIWVGSITLEGLTRPLVLQFEERTDGRLIGYVLGHSGGVGGTELLARRPLYRSPAAGFLTAISCSSLGGDALNAQPNWRIEISLTNGEKLGFEHPFGHTTALTRITKLQTESSPKMEMRMNLPRSTPAQIDEELRMPLKRPAQALDCSLHHPKFLIDLCTPTGHPRPRPAAFSAVRNPFFHFELRN